MSQTHKQEPLDEDDMGSELTEQSIFKDFKVLKGGMSVPSLSLNNKHSQETQWGMGNGLNRSIDMLTWLE